MTGATRDDDSGASERTMLAWSRLAVGALTLGAVSVRLLPSAFGARWVVAALALTTGAAAEAYGYRAHVHDPSIRARGRAAFLLMCAIGLLAVGVMVAVLA